MIRLSGVLIDSLPALAWCGRLEKESGKLHLFHGSGVVVTSNTFVEGFWDGEFSKFEFLDAEVMCGTGGSVKSDTATFRGSSDRLSPLVSIENQEHVYISNSIIFALAASGEELDPIYPYYPYDIIKIWRQGDHCPAGEFPLKSKNRLKIHFGSIVKIKADGKTAYKIPNAGVEPSDYRHYKSILSAKVEKVMQNAAEPNRVIRSSPIAALTQGYDSSAACILAKEAGCMDAFSIADSRADDPSGDTGEENAKRLGMNYHEVDRWEFINLPPQKMAMLSLFALATNPSMAAAEKLMTNKLFITGHRGDLVWGKGKMLVHNNLGHTWARMLSGVNMMEHRLHVGYHILSPTAIMERHNEAIYRITNSKEMAPWTLNNAYDRPIARRIIEEGGIPRGSFAKKKMGTGHASLQYLSFSDPTIMQHYKVYLKETHAGVPALKKAFAKARYETNLSIWNNLSPNKKKYVRSTPLQRRYPFLLNISPLKLKWDSAFSLQWAYSVTKNNYPTPADLKNE